jgi:hypothetical protein
MSVAPNSADNPVQSAHYVRRRLMTPMFWAMMMAALLCLGAAALVVIDGPRLFPAPAVPAQARAVAPPAVSPLATAIVATSPIPTAPPPSIDDAAGLRTRVAALEARQDRLLGAAAEALAVAGLSQAASQPRPFSQTLDQFNRILAEPQVAALAPLALQGAPTRIDLAHQLDDIAARLAVEARAPGRRASLAARLAYALSRLVSVRRLDPSGSGPEALIAQAEAAANAGDIEGALALTSRLPQTTDAALRGWRESAQRRIAIDRALAVLEAQSVSDLAAARSGAS